MVLAHRNIAWKVKELVKNAGYASFDVITRYPDFKANQYVLPIIAIQILNGSNYNIEISSLPGIMPSFVADVYANSQAQLDEILDVLMTNLYDGSLITMYDMTTTEPSVIGDYSGLSTLGNIQIENSFFRKSDVPESIADNRFLYEGFFIFNAKLPLVN